MKGNRVYRTIDAAFWTDPKVRKLSWSNRGLLLYLITNPHTHVSGIYYLPVVTGIHETSLTEIPYRKGIDTLSLSGFLAWDTDREVIWVKNMMRYQGKGDKNLRSAAHHIREDLHGTPLIEEFLAFYPEVKRYGINGVSIGYSEFGDGATPDSRSLIPDSRIQREEKKTAPTAVIVPEAISSYGEFKSVKLTQDEYWKLLAKLNGSLERFITELDRYSQTQPVKFKKYKSHYLAIVKWYEQAVKKGEIMESQTEGIPQSMNADIHLHWCGICEPRHSWEHDDKWCTILGHDVICDEALAKRKAAVK